jgi:hypothetical protein
MRKQIVAVEQQHQQILERIEDMGDECVATKRNHIAEQLQILNGGASAYFERGLESLTNQTVNPDYVTAYNESVRLLVHHAREGNRAAAEIQHENLCTDIDRVEGYFRRAASRARELRRLIVKPWTDEEIAVLVDMLESKNDVMQWHVYPDSTPGTDTWVRLSIVMAKPVVLSTPDGHFQYHLGRFTARLDLRSDRWDLRYYQAEDAPRLQSQGRGRHSRYVHPHISQGNACTGEWGDVLRRAFEAHDMERFMCAVFDMLHYYNPDSPYRVLDTWHRAPKCAICGCDAPQQQYLLGRNQREIHYCNEHADDAKRLQFNELLTMAQRNLKTPRRTNVYSI